ncbi:MAG TPA: hypothetical protein VFD60_02675, partial [Nitrososphaeraceae archaeon]|nr:hypothetical protein [Nitrososphaeraceae archaeon]
ILDGSLSVNILFKYANITEELPNMIYYIMTMGWVCHSDGLKEIWININKLREVVRCCFVIIPTQT